MKTVKGEILSTTPISLSRATSILSKFVSADTGASPAVCAYLRRASATFDELNKLHKEFKSLRKCKNPKSETVTEDGELSRSFTSDLHDGEESERKKHKKKKKERGLFGNIVKREGEIVEDRVRIKIEVSDLGVEDEKKKHKKKRGEVGNWGEAKGEMKIEEDCNVGIEDNDRKNLRKYNGENGGKFEILQEDKKIINVEYNGDMGMDNGREKRKKKRETSVYQVDDLNENGHKIMVKEDEHEKKKKKKKRKSEEIEEGKETNSEESRRKKKKRKDEGDS